MTVAVDPYYAVGNTHKFRNTIKKDGVVWDLSSATVTVVFKPPYGSELDDFVRTATIENGLGGIAYYTTLTTDLSVPGTWELYFRIVDAGLDLITEPYGFEVHSR